ncbi:MAG: hypothetical protein KC618_04435, partial [Candidatus Omnitrophica bacterium]|nr:hypothetical protein [Candidatus Omnitrophota bacterium]
NIDFKNKIIAFYSKDFGEDGRLAEKRRLMFVSDVLHHPDVDLLVKEKLIKLEKDPQAYKKIGATTNDGTVKYIKTTTADGQNKFFVKIRKGEDIFQLISSIVQKLHLQVTSTQIDKVVIRYANSIPDSEEVISIQPIIDELKYFHVVYHNNVIATQTCFVGKSPAVIHYLGRTPGNSMEGKGAIVFGGNVLIDLERAVMELSEGERVDLKGHLEDILTRELFEHAAVKSVLNDEAVRGDLNGLLTEYQVPLAYQYETMVVLQKHIGQIVYGRDAEQSFKDAILLSRQSLDRLGQGVDLKPEDYAGEIIKKLFLKELDYSGDLSKIKFDEFINSFLEEEIRLAAQRLYERYFGELPKLKIPEIPQEVIKYYLMNYLKKKSSLETRKVFRLSSVIDFFFGTPAYAFESRPFPEIIQRENLKLRAAALEDALLQWPTGDFIDYEGTRYERNINGDNIFILQRNGERLEIDLRNSILSFYSKEFGLREAAAMEKINFYLGEIRKASDIPPSVKSRISRVEQDPNLFIKMGAFDESRNRVKYLLTYTADGQQKLLVRAAIGDTVESILTELAKKFHAEIGPLQLNELVKGYDELELTPGRIVDVDELLEKLKYMIITGNSHIAFDEVYVVNSDEVHVSYVEKVENGAMNHVVGLTFENNIIVNLEGLYQETASKIRRVHQAGKYAVFRDRRLQDILSKRGAEYVHKEFLREIFYHEVFHSLSIRKTLDKKDTRGALRALLIKYQVPLNIQYWVMEEVQAYLGQSFYAMDVKLILEDIRYMNSSVNPGQEIYDPLHQHDYVSNIVLDLVYSELGYSKDIFKEILLNVGDETIRAAVKSAYEKYYGEFPQLDNIEVPKRVMDFYFYEYLTKKYLRFSFIVFLVLTYLYLLFKFAQWKKKQMKATKKIIDTSRGPKQALNIFILTGILLHLFSNIAFAARQPNAPPGLSNNILAMSDL